MERPQLAGIPVLVRSDFVINNLKIMLLILLWSPNNAHCVHIQKCQLFSFYLVLSWFLKEAGNVSISSKEINGSANYRRLIKEVMILIGIFNSVI